MYCSSCGKELRGGVKFCSFCGKQVADTEMSFGIHQKTRNQPTGRMIKIALPIFLFIVIITVVLICIPSNQQSRKNELELKYEWGTSASEIEENEIVFDMWRSGYDDGIRLRCEDVYHEVDGLQELPFDEEVFYSTDSDDELYRISYYTDEDLSLTETLDILINRYGEDYYVDTEGTTVGGTTDERLYTYYWWIDDTIIEYYHYSIDYYDAEKKYEHVSSDMKEFFNKD